MGPPRRRVALSLAATLLCAAAAVGFTVDCDRDYTDCDKELSKLSDENDPISSMASNASNKMSELVKELKIKEAETSEAESKSSDTKETETTEETKEIFSTSEPPKSLSAKGRYLNISIDDLQDFANALHNESQSDKVAKKSVDLSDVTLDDEDFEYAPHKFATGESRVVNKSPPPFTIPMLESREDTKSSKEEPKGSKEETKSSEEAADGCVEIGISYKVGEKVEHGCEETCECGRNGKWNCQARCQNPYIRRGRSFPDPLCYETPVDDCCAIVACSTHTESDMKSQRSPMDFKKMCRYENKSYAYEEQWEVGCQLKCSCGPDTVVTCKPRCETLVASDQCINVQDPHDACCQVQICDVTHDEHEDIPSVTTMQDRMDSPIEEVIFTTEMSRSTSNDSHVTEPVTGVSVLNDTTVTVSTTRSNTTNNMFHLQISRDGDVNERDIDLGVGNIIENLESNRNYTLKVKETGASFKFTTAKREESTTTEVLDTMPIHVLSEIITSNASVGCYSEGKFYRVGEEFRIGCSELCECIGPNEKECAALECPSHVGLELVSPTCVRWAPDPPEWVPEPPACCPTKMRCLSDGSCDYQGHKIPNWSEVPEYLTGCELRCFCESGTLDCQNICTPLPPLPPQTLRCQPNYKPGPVNISEDDCCKQWGCVPIVPKERDQTYSERDFHSKPTKPTMSFPISIIAKTKTNNAMFDKGIHLTNFVTQLPPLLNISTKKDILRVKPLNRYSKYNNTMFTPEKKQTDEDIEEKHIDITYDDSYIKLCLGPHADKDYCEPYMQSLFTTPSPSPRTTIAHKTKAVEFNLQKLIEGSMMPEEDARHASSSTVRSTDKTTVIAKTDLNTTVISEVTPPEKFETGYFFLPSVRATLKHTQTSENPTHDDDELSQFHVPKGIINDTYEEYVNSYIGNHPFGNQESYPSRIIGMESEPTHHLRFQPTIAQTTKPLRNQPLNNLITHILSKQPPSNQLTHPLNYHINNLLSQALSIEQLNNQLAQPLNDELIKQQNAQHLTDYQQTFYATKDAVDHVSHLTAAPETTTKITHAYVSMTRQQTRPQTPDVHKTKTTMTMSAASLSDPTTVRRTGTSPPTVPAKTMPFLPTIPPEIHFPEDPNEFTNNNDLHHSPSLPTPKSPPQFSVPGLIAPQPHPLDNSKLMLRSLVSDTPSSVKILFELSPVLVGLRGSVDLRYTDKDDEDVSRWYSQIFAPTDEVLTTARLEFRLTGLKPSTVYKLRGKLYLLNLALEPVSDIYTVRTLEEAPVEEKRRSVEAGLRIVRVNSSTAQVSWRHFSEEELQYVDGIQVRYRPIEQPIYSMTELLHHWRVSAELTDLRPATNYEASLVLVAPSKSRVELYDSRTVNFTTPPYYDMYNFNVTVEARRVGSESVEVTWSGVPAPPERYIRVYRAAHSCDGTMTGPGMREHDTFKLADRDQLPVILLEGLRADSKCRVWLELFLTNGKVKISNVLDITTKRENTDDNVDNIVKASSVGSRSGHNGDYYSALVVVGVVAALGTLTSLLLLLVVMRRHRPHSVSITTVPSAPRAPSLPPYDNPAYKLELQQETMDL